MSADPLRTPLCDLLGIRVPILLAPMAGGPATPELVAAVTRSGGAGIFGATGMTRAAIGAAVEQALALGGPPVGVNVQLAPPSPGPGDAAATERYLAPLLAELGVERGSVEEPPPADPPLALVEAALGAGATIVSAALGDPAPLAPLARAADAPVVAMVSTVDEARRSVASGADVLIAQGAEAGGHRTTFDLDGGLPLVGGMALVPRVVDAVEVPVVAAGAIMDGRGLAAALALGAQGVAVGTRFLLAEEAGVSDAYRGRLLAAADTDTFVTDAVTGRPARWVGNRVARALAEEGPPSLGWPAQHMALAPLRAAAARAGDAELLPVLAGQGAGMAAAVGPAAEIVEEIADGARAVLRRLAGG